MVASTVVYRERDFPVLLACRFLSTIAMQVLSVALGWQVYDLTRSPLALGLVGLCEFAPMFLLILPAGDLADRTDPRRVYTASLLALAICGALLFVNALAATRLVWPYFALLVAIGAARGCAGPSSQSLVSFIVAPEILPRSIAWNSSTMQVAVIIGPALGGMLYAFGPAAAYGTMAACLLAAALGIATLGGRRRAPGSGSDAPFAARIAEGITFVRHRRVILGAISLDLFAVLLGGATALLPIFARDLLHVGPLGLGLLRSAPAVGAAFMAASLGRKPLERHVGSRMFAAVAIFGVATIVFGLSHNFYLTLASLVVLGASDMVSVNVRHSLVQLATPDAMRGRVSAVSVLFIGASNELGEFESGVTAAWFGTIPAVVIGGLGTLAVVALWMQLFPALRRIDRFADASLLKSAPA
ncbi:MAG TPA: MFS transporter [Rhizomicrobium sp.]|jgi:MFS family permease